MQYYTQSDVLIVLVKIYWFKIYTILEHFVAFGSFLKFDFPCSSRPDAVYFKIYINYMNNRNVPKSKFDTSENITEVLTKLDKSDKNRFQVVIQT